MSWPTQLRPRLRAGSVLMLASGFLVTALNQRFWAILLDGGEAGGGPGLAALGAIAASLFALTLLVLLPLGLRWLLKPGLTVVLLLAAGAAHFIDAYGVVIDRHALASVFQTDAREAGEWVSASLAGRIVLLGLLPAALLWWIRIEWRRPLQEALARAGLGTAALAMLFVVALGFGKDVASVLRNHMELRHVANPFAIVAASWSYHRHARIDGLPFTPIGADAARGESLAPDGRPLVLVLAIGESTRAASLDLNGYARDTDFDLHRVPLVNFPDVRSCGTNTATSLPCMFSDLPRDAFDAALASHRENLLDLLMRAGYDVVWLDNNTGSKGIAARAREIRVSEADAPGLCSDEGCYDEALVVRLRKVLAGLRRDTVVVVHLLGSHGPAYHARYPAEASVFEPECRSNELQACSDAELRNTYDNTVLYTSRVLAEIAGLLGEAQALPGARDDALRRCLVRRGHAGHGTMDCSRPSPPPATPAAASPEPAIDASMLFVSDHGESLGEHGLYLHGAPYAIAPPEQTRVPMLFWTSHAFAERRGLDLGCLRRRSAEPLSHDNFFHSVLGLADVRSSVHQRQLDVFARCTTLPAGRATAAAGPGDPPPRPGPA